MVRQLADIGERAAAVARIDPPVDDPPAESVEFDRQRAVELAGRVDVVEAEILQEHRGLDPDDVEGQPPGLVGGEIERRRMEDQFPPGKGPAPALDPHPVVAEQLIFDLAVDHRNAGIDLLHLRLLPRRGLEADEVVESQGRGQARDRAESGRQIGVRRGEGSAAFHAVGGPFDVPVADDRALDIRDDAEREMRELVGLERLVEPQFAHQKIGRTRSVAQPVPNHCVDYLRPRLSLAEAGGRIDDAAGEAETRVAADQRFEAIDLLGVGKRQPAVEGQRPARPAPATVDFAHIERHGADLPARARQFPRHAVRRAVPRDPLRCESRDAVSLPEPDVGERDRPAHRREVDFGATRIEGEGRGTACAAEPDSRNADRAAQAARTGAQQRSARTAAQVDTRLAEPESRHRNPVDADPGATAIEREVAGRRKRTGERNAQPLDPPIADRARKLGPRGKAQRAALPAGKADRVERKPGSFGRIGVEAREAADRPVGAAIERQRSRRQLPAAEGPASVRDHCGLGGSEKIGDPAVRTADETSAAGARQLRGQQIDPRIGALALQRERRFAARIGEHRRKRLRRAAGERTDRASRQSPGAVDDRPAKRGAAARLRKADRAVDRGGLFADDAFRGQVDAARCKRFAMKPRHRGIDVDRGAVGGAVEGGFDAEPIGRVRSRDEPFDARIGLPRPASQVFG